MKNNTYEENIHRLGRISGLIVLCMIILVPLLVTLYFGIFPPLSGLIKGLIMVSMVYIPISVAEFLTFTPMLGANASYLAFVTGNISNLKIPCAMTCMANAKVEPQTPEGEVIAAIAVSVSSLVTIIIVFLGMLLVVPLKPVLEAPALQPAFTHILPALYGGLGAYWIHKQWRLAIVPLSVVILLFLTLNLSPGIEGALIPVLGIISVVSARIMYKRGFIKD